MIYPMPGLYTLNTITQKFLFSKTKKLSMYKNATRNLQKSLHTPASQCSTEECISEQSDEVDAHSHLQVSPVALFLAEKLTGFLQYCLKWFVSADVCHYIDDGHFTEAFMTFALVALVHISSPLKGIYGLLALYQLHHEHREQPKQRRPVAVNVQTYDDICCMKYYLDFAISAYGYHTLGKLGVLPASECRDNMGNVRDTLRQLPGGEGRDIDVVLEDLEGQVYRPGHFVCVDHQRQSVVVGIRGSETPVDVLTFLNIQTTRFNSIYDEDFENPVEGTTHRGFLLSAQSLDAMLQPVITQLLLDHPGYKAVLTGHSLGAAVSTLLTLMWAQIPLFRERHIHAYTFATPQVLCEELAQAPFTMRHVSTAIVADDIVPRFSKKAFKEMHHGVIHLGRETSMEPGECGTKIVSIKSLPKVDSDYKLSCGGRVWMFDSQDYPEHRAVCLDEPHEVFDSVLLSKTTLNSHPILSYHATIHGFCADPALEPTQIDLD
ncbi:hypothetical protein SARC_09404 [Sphaeroforma arctica JP610]|uniref:sn-1-specific diacylglycerol lipase n=1 Tax=Sphaeroforma arctica JP610 TaxID=667725 RepID=A0A0L0FNW8_9EUKA|nr:hypothetical protein SARC_09404 [Sphaeroforma arctica JP610]KNC78151.1 hypothetical protein SARC_09404 [Sphaeroforma arctica JP610]|eukprot:XP_014152053.1 hypothetical protein SARC_09404 [Sphaeroforma arctica JP610]